jgi:hypothetical protein
MKPVDRECAEAQGQRGSSFGMGSGREKGERRERGKKGNMSGMASWRSIEGRSSMGAGHGKPGAHPDVDFSRDKRRGGMELLIVNCMHNDTCAGRTNGGKARRVEPCEPGPVGLGASQQQVCRIQAAGYYIN